jgi:hypothetical protein
MVTSASGGIPDQAARRAITSYRFRRRLPATAKSSPTATSARGTPSTGMDFRWPSSTGTPPSQSPRSMTSPGRLDFHAARPRPSNCGKQDSPRYRTSRPGCGPSSTPTGSPAAQRSCQHAGGPCCMTRAPALAIAHLPGPGPRCYKADPTRTPGSRSVRELRMARRPRACTRTGQSVCAHSRPRTSADADVRMSETEHRTRPTRGRRRRLTRYHLDRVRG